MRPALSRRQVLAGLATIGAIAGLQGCDPNWQLPSPGLFGPYNVGRWIFGQTPGTVELTLPDGIRPNSSRSLCDGTMIFCCPTNIPLFVYFPAAEGLVGDPNFLTVPISDREESYPLMLFGHAHRDKLCASPPRGLSPGLADNSHDYMLVDTVLSHIASYGCVVAAPDLSGFTVDGQFTNRAIVLAAVHHYLQSVNAGLFFGKLDFSRVLLAGHSMGGAACLPAREMLVNAGGVPPVAMGLIAPAGDGSNDILAANQAPNALMVLKGGRDDAVQNHPQNIFDNAGMPKVLVTIPGANHFGYTDICSTDNQVCATEDNPGGISRLAQQVTAAAYLTALMLEFAKQNYFMSPYLRGLAIPELTALGAKGIAIEHQGMI